MIVDLRKHKDHLAEIQQLAKPSNHRQNARTQKPLHQITLKAFLA